jgi:hypothetical protein
MKKHATLFFGLLALLSTARVAAQTPTDAILMDKNQLCNALLYTNSSWSEYWEGTLRRDNPNIGTNTTQSVMYMANYGITKRLNVMAALPYVWTSNSAGHLAGQRGIQDVSLWAKYRALQHTLGAGDLSVFGTLGASTPTNRYPADLLPMSIGMGCSSASGRLIADYRLHSGIFVTAQGGYTARSRTKIDRDAYQYNGEIIYSNSVPVPNMADYSVNLGFRRGYFNVSVNYAQMLCLSGDDIRRNDMPFCSNNMDASSVGFLARYHAKHLGFVVSGSQVYAGRNVGRSTTVQAGILYAFYVKKSGE